MKAREDGGEMVDHLPELSSLRQEMMGSGARTGRDRPGHRDRGSPSFTESVRSWRSDVTLGTVPPPAPEVPGLPEDHYRS